MTRALVTQLADALNKCTAWPGAHDECSAAVTAAREYLATEQLSKAFDAAVEVVGEHRVAKSLAVPSGERAKVGDSRFESWYSELQQSGKGSKQVAREAYEAGLNEADAQQAKPKTAGERAQLIAEHQELNTNNYTSDDVEALNDWANQAYDMLEADVSLINEGNKAQQAKQVPLSEGDIDAIGMFFHGDYRMLRNFARAIEAHHGIGGEA